MKFKLDDKVKCVKLIEDEDDFKQYLGKVGIVYRVNREDYSIEFEAPLESLIMFEPELELYGIIPEELFAI